MSPQGAGRGSSREEKVVTQSFGGLNRNQGVFQRFLLVTWVTVSKLVTFSLFSYLQNGFIIQDMQC